MLLKREEKKKEDHGAIIALSQVFEMGYLIAIPIVILAFVGRHLDLRYDASPWFLLVGIFLSVLLSSYLVYTRMKRFL